MSAANPQKPGAVAVEAAIREALDAETTLGPWQAKRLANYSEPGWVILWPDTTKPGTHMRRLDYAGNVTEADARLIAACNPEAMRTLLSELDRLRASQSDGASSGWIPAPAKPTTEMIAAGMKRMFDEKRYSAPWDDVVDLMYRAMLAAPPSTKDREYPPLPAREDRPALNAIPYRVYTEDQMRAYVDADRAAVSRAPAESGWQWVPVEPTDEMLKAGRKAIHDSHSVSRKALLVHKAMLKAAPSAAQPGESEGGKG